MEDEGEEDELFFYNVIMCWFSLWFKIETSVLVVNACEHEHVRNYKKDRCLTSHNRNVSLLTSLMATARMIRTSSRYESRTAADGGTLTSASYPRFAEG